MKADSWKAAASVAAVLAASPALLSPASAEITVYGAEYAAGVLVVRGDTSPPNQTVWLDERFSKRSNRFGDFTFRIRYLPRNCTIKLEAGRDVRPAVVRGCTLRDAPAYEPTTRRRR